MNKKALLLVNLGTPDKPSYFSVARYLRTFLNDGRVIDVHPLLRSFLVHVLIVPLRTFKSVRMYRKIWNANGSPLLFYSNNLKNKIKRIISSDTDIYLAMRYGNPGLDKCLKELERKKYRHITLVPLFPQYASSTSGTIISLVLKRISSWNTIPDIHIIASFYNQSQYIHAMASRLRNAMNKRGDQHVLYTFHSIPLRHVNKFHDGGECSESDCRHELNNDNAGCYRAVCYETAKLISKAAGIHENDYSVSFQSRFARKWLGPFTEDVLKELAGNGKRHIVVIAPSFVTDCLETILELDHDYRELFMKRGGESYVLVESLNDEDEWVKGLAGIIDSEA